MESSPQKAAPKDNALRLGEATPAPPAMDERVSPWVQLKTFNFNPCLYPAMLGKVSADAKAGDRVAIYDKTGNHFGTGFYNPKARVPLRVFHHGREPVGEDFLERALDQALQLRTEQLKFDDQTNTYRVVNSDGDGLSGLVVDRYAEVLSVEFHSLAIFNRLMPWLKKMHAYLGTQKAYIHVDPQVARWEGIKGAIHNDTVKNARVRENGLRFEVDFTQGHKTGFFCDQRDNRLKLSRLVKGRRVLDLCCYTGGFSIYAAALGAAEEVTGVDLDETAIAQARRNGNLNQQNRIHWVHADAFAYARQMQKNGEKWGAVILDPSKFIGSREEEYDGRRKYEDLNSLGISLLEPYGLLVTCSCSGLLSLEEFEFSVVRAAHRMGRRLQFIDRTGAGADHPVMSNSPEGRYLKVLWARVI